MYALDAATGERRWEFDAGNWAVTDAAVSGGAVYFSNCNHEVPRQACRLYALEARTGAPLWEHVATGTLLSTPALGDGVIYFVLSGGVVALR
jgi:serine/threonine-protein kinase